MSDALLGIYCLVQPCKGMTLLPMFSTMYYTTRRNIWRSCSERARGLISLAITRNGDCDCCVDDGGSCLLAGKGAIQATRESLADSIALIRSALSNVYIARALGEKGGPSRQSIHRLAQLYSLIMYKSVQHIIVSRCFYCCLYSQNVSRGYRTQVGETRYNILFIHNTADSLYCSLYIHIFWRITRYNRLYTHLGLQVEAYKQSTSYPTPTRS